MVSNVIGRCTTTDIVSVAVQPLASVPVSTNCSPVIVGAAFVVPKVGLTIGVPPMLVQTKLVAVP